MCGGLEAVSTSLLTYNVFPSRGAAEKRVISSVVVRKNTPPIARCSSILVLPLVGPSTHASSDSRLHVVALLLPVHFLVVVCER